jgi:hypothetical protein
MLNGLEIRNEREKQKERQAVKDTLRVIRANHEDGGPEEDGT